MSTLFGSSPSVSKTPVYLQSSLSGGQQSTADVLTNALSGTGASNYTQYLFPSYTGTVGAPVTSATTGAVSGLEASVPSATTAASTTPTTTSTGIGALSNALTSQPQDLSSYYKYSLYGPAEQTLQQTTLPGVMSSSGGSVGGYQSSSESASVADAVGAMYDSLGSSIGTAGYDTSQQNVKDLVNALGQVSTVTTQPSTTLSNILKAGTDVQTGTQSYLSKLYTDYTQGLTDTQTFIKNIIDYLDTQTLTSATQTTTSGGSSGLIGSIFSGLASSELGTSLGNLIGGGSTGTTSLASGATTSMVNPFSYGTQVGSIYKQQ